MILSLCKLNLKLEQHVEFQYSFRKQLPVSNLLSPMCQKCSAIPTSLFQLSFSYILYVFYSYFLSSSHPSFFLKPRKHLLSQCEEQKKLFYHHFSLGLWLLLTSYPVFFSPFSSPTVLVLSCVPFYLSQYSSYVKPSS